MYGDARSLTTEDWVERLHHDVLSVPAEESEAPLADDLDRLNYAALEFEMERTRKRLAIWDIFLGYMKSGAQDWDEIRHALSADDLERITAICDGLPLRDVLLDLD